MTDKEVKTKIKLLFEQWAVAYRDTQGLAGIANLYTQLPQRRRPRPQPPALRETSPDHDKEVESPRSPTGHHPATSSRQLPAAVGHSDITPNQLSKSHKKSGSKTKNKTTPFNLEKEKPAMLQALANASVSSTNLKNALKLINREVERPCENAEVAKRFDVCKQLRRSILRYIQHVESEQWLGGLIHANEELVEALTCYELLNKPIEEDSDSEAEWNNPPDGSIDEVSSGIGMLKMRGALDGPPMPPRPGTDNAKGKQRDYETESEEEEDPDNPFGDRRYRIADTEESTVKW